MQAIETSLRYLDGRIDLLLMHAPGEPGLRAETWRALEEAKEAVSFLRSESLPQQYLMLARTPAGHNHACCWGAHVALVHICGSSRCSPHCFVG